MQSAKGSLMFKFDQFEVRLCIFNQKKLEITVVDPYEKMEFHEKLLTLTNIGTSTLVKAFEKKMLEIKLGMKVKKTPEDAILQIDVLVASQFLKPVEETIYLKKTKDITETELLKNGVNMLSVKIKQIKQGDKNNSNFIYYGTVQEEEKVFNSNNNVFEQIASIKLNKGKYVLTLSFLGKVNNLHMYIYFQQSQPLVTNNGFFFPNNSNFFPITIRKTHLITSESETVKFSTYYGQSYPKTLKNVILTAQLID